MADKAAGVPEFFAGRDIFVTGTSGVVGKPFVEKLLRSCPDVGRVYVLLRAKKGKTVEERLKKMKELKLFEKLREDNPEALNKITPIEGDVTELNLGISEKDRQTLINNVSIVYHVAASVKFDDHLHFAILMNVRGTREAASLALQMKNIEAFVHVSTTYSNCDKKVVQEKLYPPLADWRTAIKMAETMDPNVIDILTAKYLGEIPNTYVITKQMAEHVVNDMCKGRVSAVIVRISIVTSSVEEPFPGWFDSLNGPAGLIFGVGLGVIRSVYSDPDIIPDYIPVDICAKALLVSAWYECTRRNKNLDVAIYNCCGGKTYSISPAESMTLGLSIIQEKGMERSIWYPTAIVTNCKYEHYLIAMLFQVLPSLILDGLLLLAKHKPLLYKVQRRVHVAMMMALTHFIFNEWTFVHDKFLALNDKIPEKDYENFRLKAKNYDDFDMERYAQTAYTTRVYIMPESSTPEELRQRALRLKHIHYTFVGIIALLLFYVFMLKLTKLINWLSYAALLGTYEV